MDDTTNVTAIEADFAPAKGPMRDQWMAKEFGPDRKSTEESVVTNLGDGDADLEAVAEKPVDSDTEKSARDETDEWADPDSDRNKTFFDPQKWASRWVQKIKDREAEEWRVVSDGGWCRIAYHYEAKYGPISAEEQTKLTEWINCAKDRHSCLDAWSREKSSSSTWRSEQSP